MIGGGFVKGMMDTIQYNRGLLGKKKSLKERYKEEIKNRVVVNREQDIKAVELRVSARLKVNKVHERWSRISVIVFLVFTVVVLLWIIFSVDFSWKSKGKYADKDRLFKTVVYERFKDQMDLLVLYFPSGIKAQEMFLKEGKKHQNSESYYETGEQFRSALYYYDSLVNELYFFKNGDTIKNFPTIRDGNVHHLKFPDRVAGYNVAFDFYEGKIIQGTYEKIKSASKGE